MFQLIQAGAVVFLLGFVLVAGVAVDIALLVNLRRSPWNTERGAGRLRVLPWGAVDAAAVMMILVAAQAIGLSAAMCTYQFGLLTEPQAQQLQLVFQTTVFPLVGVLSILAVMRARRVRLPELIGRNGWRGNLRLGGVLYLAMLPPVAFYSLLYLWILQFFGYDVGRQSVVLILLDPEQPLWLRVQLIFLAVTLIPAIEEFIFRGIALPALMKRMSTVPAVCVISLLFAALHFHLPSMVPLFVVAFALSMAYIYSGSLIVPVTMHALFNAVNLGSLLLLRDVPEELLKLQGI